MQLLSQVEIDGRFMEFEHGMLLFRELTADGADHWHIVLLCVPADDMTNLTADCEAHRTVVAHTTRGECLVGRARPFRAADDCLRLIGVSSLEWE